MRNALKSTFFILLSFSLLIACTSNPSLSTLSAEQRDKVSDILFLDSDVLPKDSYTVLGTVKGIACKRNLYATGAPSVQEAQQGVRIRAVQLDADAVIGLLCEDNQEVDWGNNCWQSIICIGDAINIQDSAVLARLQSASQPEQPPVRTTGTGWVAEPGYIVTNHHVVADRSEIVAYLHDGRSLEVSVVTSDPINDLALLVPIQANAKLPPALRVAGSEARIGAEVFTVGFPHTDILGSNPKVTNGIVSSNSGMEDDPRVYQVTVPLQSGNSGGPLITMDGNVVGVTTSKLNAVRVFQYTGDLPQGVNYAVKSHYVAAILASTRGKQSAETDASELVERLSSLEVAVEHVRRSVVQLVAQ